MRQFEGVGGDINARFLAGSGAAAVTAKTPLSTPAPQERRRSPYGMQMEGVKRSETGDTTAVAIFKKRLSINRADKHLFLMF